MTIDEAIEYYIKVATQRELADEEKGDYDKWNETRFLTKKQSMQIIAENRQLAEWLKELKDLREENKDWKEEYAILNKISYGYYKELKKAKQLLKFAIEDFASIDEVKLLPENTIRPMLEYTRIIDIVNPKWRYADEAEELLKE